MVYVQFTYVIHVLFHSTWNIILPRPNFKIVPKQRKSVFANYSTLSPRPQNCCPFLPSLWLYTFSFPFYPLKPKSPPPPKPRLYLIVNCWNNYFSQLMFGFLDPPLAMPAMNSLSKKSEPWKVKYSDLFQLSIRRIWKVVPDWFFIFAFFLPIL